MTHSPTPVTDRFETTTGIRLAYDHYRRGHDELVIVTHGITANRRLPEIQRLAEHLGERFDVLTYDVRGHGESSGKFSFGLYEWEDLAELARDQRGAYREVAGIGFSFGSFHTCVAAAQRDCFDAVVLVSGLARLWLLDHNFFLPGPFFEERRYKKGRPRPRFHPGIDLKQRLTPMKCVGDVRAPLQIIHGDRDWLIHRKHSEKLAARATAPCDLVILPGGVHAEFLIDQMPERFLPLVRDWLGERLGGEQGEPILVEGLDDS